MENLLWTVVILFGVIHLVCQTSSVELTYVEDKISRLSGLIAGGAAMILILTSLAG